MTAKKFNSFREAMDFMKNPANEKSPDIGEAIICAMENAPPKLQGKMKTIFYDVFPEFVPEYVDSAGNGYYNPEKIRKTFGISKDEFYRAVAKDNEGLEPCVDVSTLIPVH